MATAKQKKCTHPTFFFLAQQKGIFCPHCQTRWLRKVDYFQGMRYSKLEKADDDPPPGTTVWEK